MIAREAVLPQIADAVVAAARRGPIARPVDLEAWWELVAALVSSVLGSSARQLWRCASARRGQSRRARVTARRRRARNRRAPHDRSCQMRGCADNLSRTDRRPAVMRRNRRAFLQALETTPSDHHAIRAFARRPPASSGEDARTEPIPYLVRRFARMHCETTLPIARRRRSSARSHVE